MYYIKTAEGWKPWLASYVACSNSNDLKGVFKPEPIEVVEKKLDGRIERFLRANGIQNMSEKVAHFRGNSFPEPLFGAFGEKL